MDVDWIDHLTLLPSPQVHVQVTAIIDTLAQQVAVSQTVGGAEVDESQDGGQQEKPLSSAMRALLYEVGKVPDASDKTAGCRYGKVYRHRSAEGGLFVYFPQEDQLLVIWDRGEVSLLHSSSSSGSLTYVDYEQGLEMTQHSHIPLSSIHIPYALPTPIPSPAKPTVSLLEEVRVVFASLSPTSLRNLVLGKEALAMCGYMLDRGGYVCLETHSPTWGSGKGASFPPQKPSPAVQMDLEEGEEVEGEVAENGAIEGLAGGGWAPAHSKLLAQAKVYVILPAPLDFVALDCEMCLTGVYGFMRIMRFFHRVQYARRYSPYTKPHTIFHALCITHCIPYTIYQETPYLIRYASTVHNTPSNMHHGHNPFSLFVHYTVLHHSFYTPITSLRRGGAGGVPGESAASAARGGAGCAGQARATRARLPH